MKRRGEMKMNIQELREGIKDVKQVVEFTNTQIKLIEGLLKRLTKEGDIIELKELLKCKKLYVELLTDALENAQKDLTERESKLNG